MKIITIKTKASLERRKELQSKIATLLREYDDVPIFVAHNLILKSNDDFVLDFDKNDPENHCHIINGCIIN